MKMVRPNLILVILTLTFLYSFHSRSAEESLVGGSRIVDQSKVNQLALVTNSVDNTLSIYSIRGTEVTPQGTVPTGDLPGSVAIALVGPTQHQVEKAIQEVQPEIPEDIVKLIAQFTTSHVNKLEELLYKLIKSGQFDMSAAISSLQRFINKYPQKMNRMQEAVESRLKSVTEELARAQAELEEMVLLASPEVEVGEERLAPVRAKVDQLKETQERLEKILNYIHQARDRSIPRM